MHRLIRHRPSPAMVVACLALLVALTGTSVAAVQAIAPNSVGTPQLRTGAVTNPKLRANAVTGAKVANRSLTAIDFQASSLPRGPQGVAGPAGPAGAAGPAGTIGPISVRQASVVVPGGVGSEQRVRHRDSLGELQSEREGDLRGHGLERRRRRP